MLRLLQVLRTALSLAASVAPHLLGDQVLTQTRMAGQTCRRRAARRLGGISRLSKERLVELCGQHGVPFPEEATRLQLIDILYQFEPDGDFESGSGPRRTRDPNMPGLAALSKAALTKLMEEYQIPIPAGATKETLKQLLYNHDPFHGRPAPHERASASSPSPTRRTQPGTHQPHQHAQPTSPGTTTSSTPTQPGTRPRQQHAQQRGDDQAETSWALVEEGEAGVTVATTEAAASEEDMEMQTQLREQAMIMVNSWNTAERENVLRALLES